MPCWLCRSHFGGEGLTAEHETSSEGTAAVLGEIDYIVGATDNCLGLVKQDSLGLRSCGLLPYKSYSDRACLADWWGQGGDRTRLDWLG